MNSETGAEVEFVSVSLRSGVQAAVRPPLVESSVNIRSLNVWLKRTSHPV